MEFCAEQGSNQLCDCRMQFKPLDNTVIRSIGRLEISYDMRNSLRQR